MLAYQHLNTEKHVHKSMRQRAREIKQARRRKAIQDFRMFLLGLVAIPFAMLLGQQAPKWAPLAMDLLKSIGTLD